MSEPDVTCREVPRGVFDLTRRSLLVNGAIGLAGVAIGPAARAGPADGSALDTFLTTQMRAGSIPGLAIGITRGGHILLVKGYGLADLAAERRVTTDSIFPIASVTKTVTATGIMMLVEEGRIALDAPVDQYLDFAVTNPAAPEVPITVRQLLMHMSSISDETYYEVDFRTRGRDTPLALGDFLRNYLVPGGAHYAAGKSFAKQAPGLAYDYSNVGYGLLGYLGGRVAGMDFRTYLDRRLFDRLGMKSLSWSVAGVPAQWQVTPYDVGDKGPQPTEPVGFPDWPAGMLRTSIASFMPFLAAAANRGVAGRKRMLSEASMTQMLAMRTLPGLPSWLTGQGLGWMESADSGMRHINHWGGDPGTFTAAYLDPASTTGLAIFTNVSPSNSSKAAIKAIAHRILDDSGDMV
jgi:CubicO group peptidase (beta-lactamase class C family)